MKAKPKHAAPASEGSPEPRARDRAGSQPESVPAPATVSDPASEVEAGTGADGWDRAPRAVPMRPVGVSRKRAGRRAAGARRDSRHGGGQSPVRSASRFQRRRNPFGTVFRFLGALLAVAALLLVAVGGTLAVTEFRPRATQPAETSGEAGAALQPGQQVSLLTWNIGYGGLPAQADSFTDGGAGVRAESADAVRSVVSSIDGVLQEQGADIVLLQETDRDSSRSCGVDQEEAFAGSFGDAGYSCAYAQDHRVLYVPYPWPCLGKVDSGLMTASRFQARSAERVALPQDGSFVRDLVAPESCLLVTRIPVEGTGRDLVVANARFTDRAPQELQDAQSRQLALLMKRESDKGNYVIAGGDFDQNFSGTDVRYWGKEISAARSTGVLDQGIFHQGMQFAMDPAVATARSLNAPLESPDVRFYVSDGFIVSANVAVDAVRTLDTGFAYSDHNPVRLDVTLG